MQLISISERLSSKSSFVPCRQCLGIKFSCSSKPFVRLSDGESLPALIFASET